VSRYRHPAPQQSSASVHLDVAARTSHRRVTAVPPLRPPFAIPAGGSQTRFNDVALLAAHPADARAYACDAVSLTICTIVRAAG
jgi:hypothetical protein